MVLHGVAQRTSPSAPHAEAGRSPLTQGPVSLLRCQQDPSTLWVTACPVLKFSAWFQSTLPFSWFSTSSFSSILKITVSIFASLEYCKPIHFTLFINQIQTNQREYKKINLYLCHHFLLETYESTQTPGLVIIKSTVLSFLQCPSVCE